MITLHLEAETLAELRDKAHAALYLTAPLHVPDGNRTYPERPGANPAWADVTSSPGTIVPDEPQEPVQRDKPRRAHRRVRPVEAPVAAPVAAPDPEPDPLEEAIDQLTNEVDADDAFAKADDVAAGIEVLDTVSNEMLKREVISSLADMFTAGNVKVVRHVLHKYGRGAKSFPEIDPVHFPEIKAALDRNEAA